MFSPPAPMINSLYRPVMRTIPCLERCTLVAKIQFDQMEKRLLNLISNRASRLTDSSSSVLGCTILPELQARVECNRKIKFSMLCDSLSDIIGNTH